MAIGQSTWSFGLRLVVNGVPWLIVLDSVWSIARQVWLDRPVTGSIVTKLIFFALVGLVVTWKLPPYDVEAGFGPNFWWLFRLIVNLVLWIAVIDRVWMMLGAIWMRDPIGFAFVAYTVFLAIIASLVSWKWMPRGPFGTEM